MVNQNLAGAPTFKEMEQAGWHAKASDYDALAGQVTTQVTDVLLDATQVTKDSRLLDVACGPGYGAGAAGARGEHAVGVDFAEAMVNEAKSRFPNAEFRACDAEKMSFEDGSFDAVICAFGLLHMSDPDKAIGEAYRVLRSGGRYAFSVWATPDTHEFFTLVLSAIQAHGTMDVPLPEAPPIFRFSDPGECRNVLTAAGFFETGVKHAHPIWQATSGQQVLDMVYKSAVRTPALLELQSPDAREKIHKQIIEGAETYKVGATYNIAWPAVVAWGVKP